MRYVITILFYLSSFVVFAETDHPLVAAYPNATIKRQAISNYAEVLIPRAKLVKGEQFDAFSVVGKQTGHIYRVEGQDSALQIAENYDRDNCSFKRRGKGGKLKMAPVLQAVYRMMKN